MRSTKALIKFGICFSLVGLLFSAFPVLANTTSYSEAKLKKLAWSEGWLNRLQYEKNVWGKWRSLVDGKSFFFSDKGHLDPYKELLASLEAMNKDIKVGKLGQIPLCAFPERYLFLSEQLGFQLKKVKCKKLEEFLVQFKEPQGISLVFSSAYPNNPASMFGHTFFKVRSKANSDLVDQGLSYAAFAPDDENGLLFIWFGMTGGYLGKWSNLPYYVKINEYINTESRDIWEYELNLTPDQALRVVLHLWEIETNSFFEYFFFDENCAYHLLRTLLIVKPEWKTMLQHNIYVIPGETVKRVADIDGAVRSVVFRPSRHKKLMQHYESLNKNEKKQFHELMDQPELVPKVQSRPVLDALATYYEYSTTEKKKRYKADYKAKREKLLSHRATLGVRTTEEKARLIPIVSETRPDWGHHPYSISLGRQHISFDIAGESEIVERSSLLKLESAYHDILNRDKGYTPFAHIEFPQIVLKKEDGNSDLEIQSLMGLNIISLFPMNEIHFRMSWKFKVGFEEKRVFNCLDCKPALFDGGIGLTVSPMSKTMAYAMLTGKAEYESSFAKGQRYAPGVELGLVSNPFEKFKFYTLIEKSFYLDPNKIEEDQISLQWAYHPTKNTEIRSESDWFLGKTGPSELRRFESSLLFTYFYR